jgi:copper resistance protein C
MKPGTLFTPAFAPLFILVTLLGALSFGSSANAHNAVEELVPPPDSIVTVSPVAVSVATNDIFLAVGENQGGFGIVMVDQDGLFYGDGCVVLSERRMTANIELGGPGKYQVVYQFVSADGHTLSETYSVTFEPDQAHVPTQGHTNRPVCGVEATVPDSSGLDASAPGETEPGTPSSADVEGDTVAFSPTSAPTANIPVWAWALGPVVVAGVVGLGWFRARRNKR